MRKLLLTLFLCLSLINPVWAGVQSDNVDDLVTITNESNFDFTNTTEFSVVGWVKPNATRSGTNVHYALITKLNGSSPFEGWEIGLWWNNSNQPNKLVINLDEISTSSEEDGAIGSTDLQNDIWYHFAATKNTGGDPATAMNFYINGLLETITETGDGVFGTMTNNLNVGFFGRTSGTFRAYVGGTLSDVAIYNKVLSATEISILSSSRVKRMPLQISPSNLLAYWPLDDQPDGTSGDGDTFRDLSGNGNNGTGDDGANNTGLTALAEFILSYP